MKNIKIKFICTLIVAIIAIIVIGKTYGADETKPIKKNTSSSSQKIKIKAVPIQLSEAKSMTFKNQISLYAKTEAKHHAMVPLRCANVIEKLFVDEGDIVEKNKTILFQNDNFLLKQAIANAKQALTNLQVADKQRIELLKIANINLKQQKQDHNRYLALFKKNAISKGKFDIADAAYKRAQAQVNERKHFLTLGREQAKQALIALKIAEKNLSDSIIKAPIDGIITERYFEEGEMGTKGKSVFKIVNPDILDISAFVPAQYISRIVKGKTLAKVFLDEQPWRTPITVSYVSPIIDSNLHVFEIKCRVDNKSASGKILYQGQSVKLKILLDTQEGIGVPSASLVRRNNGLVVFKVANEKAVEIPVKTGIETDNYTMVYSPDIKAGDKIVVLGQFMLNNNSPISVKAK